MAVQPLTDIPGTITSGDTLAMLLSANQFPADQGWTLAIKAALPNSGTLIDFPISTPLGAQHSITVAASVTDLWTAGAYHYQVRALKGAEVYTVAAGDFSVVAALAGNQETRTFEAQMLAQVEAALLAMGSSNVIEYRIGDRSARRYTRMDLLKERAFYRSAVRRQRGEPLFRVIPTEFTSGRTLLPDGVINA